MSWSTDFWNDATYMTTTSTHGNMAEVYFVRKLLETLKNECRMINLGKPKPVPAGHGKTVQWQRYAAIPASVSTATLTEGKNPNATLFYQGKLQKSLVEYGAFVQMSKVVKDTGIDLDCVDLAPVLNNHAVSVMDQVAHREVAANGGYPMRADLDGTKTYYGTLTGTPTTTSLADTALETNSNYGDANDDLNQSIICILDGVCGGSSRTVTDYVASGGVMTVPALEQAPSAGDHFVVASVDAIASGDDLSFTNIARAVAILRNKGALTGDGNYLVGVADDFMLERLMTQDAVWKAVGEYANPGQMFAGEVGKFAGVRWIRETQPFRCPQGTIGTAGTANGPGAAGANFSANEEVNVVPIMGMGAFGVTQFARSDNLAAPQVHIKSPGPNDTSQPLNRFSTMGWQTYGAVKALETRHLVNMFVYNSMYGVGV